MAFFKSQTEFEQAFKDNWEQMYQSAYVRIGDQAAVEDIIQEIFVDVWQRRETLQIKSGLKAYLLTAVKYQVMRYYEERARYRTEELNEIQISQEPDDMLGFEALYGQIEVVIERLPSRAQLIFRMSKLEGCSVDEIADRLQLSSQTVHNQLSKSMKILRGELKHLVFSK